MGNTDAPHGVLIADKPSGPTSFDLVAQARRHFRTRRVGHAGTLDPLASGVLVLLLGEATKLSNYLTAANKRYVARVVLGTSTDTLDSQGQVVAESSVPEGGVERQALLAALQRERERELQLPPAFSAIKVDGKKAYDAARRGQTLELSPRPVRLLEAQLLERSPTELTFELEVTKGYYVRAFVRDLCEHLGIAGHLAALRRTSSGAFDLDQATPWPPGTPLPTPLTLAEAVRRSMPIATLTEEGVQRARQGKLLHTEHFTQPPLSPDLHAWLTPTTTLAAIGSAQGPHFRVQRGFNP